MSRTTTAAVIALAMVASPVAASASVVSFDQCASCGNPGPALGMIAATFSVAGTVQQASPNPLVTIDPTSTTPILLISPWVDENLSISVVLTGFETTVHMAIVPEPSGALLLGAGLLGLSIARRKRAG